MDKRRIFFLPSFRLFCVVLILQRRVCDGFGGAADSAGAALRGLLPQQRPGPHLLGLATLSLLVHVRLRVHIRQPMAGRRV